MKNKDIKKYFHLLYLLGGIALGGLAVFLFQTNPQSTELSGPTQYTCELSGGSFENSSCVCPIETELGQTQEMMYDASTGFCQSTFGGAGGDAFWAGSGLPWGRYSYYNDIVNHWCEQSGGSKSGAACKCSSGEIYDKSIGQCK
jgi:hypothetical protein